MYRSSYGSGSVCHLILHHKINKKYRDMIYPELHFTGQVWRTPSGLRHSPTAFKTGRGRNPLQCILSQRTRRRGQRRGKRDSHCRPSQQIASMHHQYRIADDFPRIPIISGSAGLSKQDMASVTIPIRRSACSFWAGRTPDRACNSNVKLQV